MAYYEHVYSRVDGASRGNPPDTLTLYDLVFNFGGSGLSPWKVIVV